MRAWLLLVSALSAVACTKAAPSGSSSERPAARNESAAATSSSAAATEVTARRDRPPAERALARLFMAERPSPEWFSRPFLASVPLSNVETTTKQLLAANGPYKGAHPEDGHWIVEFERGSLRTDVALDAEGRFAKLLFRPDELKTATLDEALADFRNLSGKVSVLVLSDGTERGSIQPDVPLAVGSAFKLATLAALRAEIDKKQRSWNDVVELRPEAKSLPSGELQDWPDRAPLTLYTLATLMIARSDNTATDELIGVVGRDAIEPFAPRNRPYLTTREMFLLKAPGNGPMLARFQSGDEPTRRASLGELRGMQLPSAETYTKEPIAPDVEWFFTARELCDLMKRVHDLPFMGINPGLAKREAWSGIAYKGGSEPGVINMTTWVEKHGGGHGHCIAGTLNGAQKLDELAFANAYTRILTWLQAQP